MKELIDELPNLSFKVFYTKRFPLISKNVIMQFGEKGYIESIKKENNVLIYVINDIANDRRIFIKDDIKKIEKTAVDLKNAFIDNTLKAFHITKNETKEYSFGIGIYSPTYGEAIDEVITLEMDGKLIRVPYSVFTIREPVFFRARNGKIEVQIDYRYFLDALFFVIRNTYEEFVGKRENK